MDTVSDQIILMAWDGSQWSEPQGQSALYTFTDPVTYDSVNFRCHQAVLSAESRMSVVGCDIIGDGDIWLTERELGDLTTWFPSPSQWSRPVIIAGGDAEISGPQIIGDPSGLFHVLWSQPDDPTQSDPETSIYYSRQEAQGWSSPVQILRSPDKSSQCHWNSADGILSIVWEDSQAGGIYYSWSNSLSAASVFEWAEPDLLPATMTAAHSPDLLVDHSGILYVVYAVPLNEGRGIYLTKSTDGGETWTEPVSVFDAVVAGWDMVDQPHLSQTDNGELHMVWSRNSLPGGKGPLALFYSRSVDGGETWIPAELVEESMILWSDLYPTGDQTLHRLWIGGDEDGVNLLDQYSSDGGRSWSAAANLSLFGEKPGPVSAVRDAQGQLHLLHIVENLDANVTMNYILWNGERWIYDEGYIFTEASFNQVTGLSSALSLNGRLAAISSVKPVEGVDNDLGNAIYFTNHTVQASDLLPIAEPDVLTPTETPTVEVITPLQQETPTLTPTFDISSLNDLGGGVTPGSSDNSMLGIIVGGGLAILLIGIAFAIGISRIRH
jgi:hypothetical protein